MCVLSFLIRVKLIVILFLISINSNEAIAQSITTYKANTSSFRFKNNDDTWKKWSDKIKVEVSFKIDLPYKTIYFYNDGVEEFNIIAKEEDISGKDDIILWCLNSRNERFVFRISPLLEDELLFLIQHKTFEFMYNVSYLGE